MTVNFVWRRNLFAAHEELLCLCQYVSGIKQFIQLSSDCIKQKLPSHVNVFSVMDVTPLFTEEFLLSAPRTAL